MYHLPGNVITATVGLVYNLQTEYEFPNSTRFGQFWKVGKIGVGGTVLPNRHYGKTFCTGSEFLFMATCASDLTFLAINFRDKRFPQIGGP